MIETWIIIIFNEIFFLFYEYRVLINNLSLFNLHFLKF